MTGEEITQVVTLLAVGLVWLLVNLKAGHVWLKVLSLVGLLAFVGCASWVALVAAGLVP